MDTKTKQVSNGCPIIGQHQRESERARERASVGVTEITLTRIRNMFVEEMV